MLLVFSFCFLFAATFAAVALASRPTRDQRFLETRLERLLATPHSATGAVPLLRERPQRRHSTAVARLLGLAPLRDLARLTYQSSGSRSIKPTVAIAGGLALAAMLAAHIALHMMPVTISACLLGAALPIFRLRAVRERRLNAFNKSLPDTIDICARSLRAGHSLVAAIGIAAEQAPEPARKEFVEIFRKQNFGLPLRDALLETLEQLPSADFRVFVTGILVQKDTGGNLTEIFDRIVNVMRERLRIEGEIRIHTAQGRMTAWILTLLPPVLFVIINVLNPGYSRPMFAEGIGRTLFYCGLVSLALGGLLVRRIVNGIEV